ncbi:MAG TPA: DUF533 domain-containing protein [Chthoniobacterales bacterium]|jgi:uncharacterized protein (DUF697 family)
MNTLDPTETEAILTLCLMASFADGEKHDREREQLKKITDSLANDTVDITALYQQVLLNKPDVATVAGRIVTPGARQLAYEMAVCVCDADDVCNLAEQQFLDQLRSALALPAAMTQPLETEAAALATVPLDSPTPAQSEETDAMILRYAIVGGALELLPQTMASLAIVPMQTKMVYRIGSQRGVQLDRKSIVEFMAAAGIGMTSQVFESFARRLTQKLGKTVAGNMGSKIGGSLGGMAMSFGTTYALGQLAKLYYDNSRTLNLETLKTKYPPLLAEGKALAQKYSAEITQQTQKLQGAGLSSLFKGTI